MASRLHPRPTTLCLALFTAGGAAAQTAAPTDLPAVTVTGRSPTSSAQIGGFGDVPLSRSPIQATVVTQEALRDGGGIGLGALTRHDASVSDAYNADGYWTSFTVRGYVIDNAYNFRRDGLPISGETSLSLANKSLVEVLKGTSGIQAGTSAPGGLVNLLVKRPDGPVRSAGVSWRERGSYGGNVDLGDRFGPEGAYGLRLNLAADHLDPLLRSARGDSYTFALAGDWRLAPGSLLEAEVERHRQSQPSQPGFSMLGDRLPSAGDTDPRVNLNNQPWSLPVVFEGTTASLRWTQALAAEWKFVAHGAVQRLVTDDRLAYPYGCSKEDRYDRYCSDGTFDYYLFRSDNEHRHTSALDLHAEGALATGTVQHHLTAGVLFARSSTELQPRPNDGVPVGEGNVDGTATVATLPELGQVSAGNSGWRSTELYVRDRIDLSADASLWAGLRHTRWHADSVRTDGSEASDYERHFTTPWLAFGYRLTPQLLAYASWGRGTELAVAPNRAGYVNAGQPLPPLMSRQFEVGLKHDGEAFDWSVTAFDIERPATADLAVEDGLLFARDGEARHRGLEGDIEWRTGPWALHAGALWLDAKRRGASDPALNGKQPPNVPERSARLNGRYAISQVPGLQLQGGLVYEGPRKVTPDNTVTIPSWTRLDLAARFQHRVAASTLTWLLGVDNATDRRAWRESPYQYSHVYLYPLAPRTWRVSMQAAF